MFSKKAVAFVIALAISLAVIANATAGSPHFINSAFTLTQTGNTITVTGKEAGLGDELQVDLVLTATAECINPGGNHPKAGNKENVSFAESVPVQNGKADFTGPYALTVTASFSPECSPPMTVNFTNVTVTDTTNGLTFTF